MIGGAGSLNPVTANFDGLVGPTHNYAGLSHGNVASLDHAGQESSPRAAVLQGLDKMAAVSRLGLVQGFLPPLARPRLDVLHGLGFSEDSAQRDAPAALLAACFSASSMWTANAATVTASTDSHGGYVQLTAANLSSKLHRSLEGPEMSDLLRRVFRGSAFVHHAPLLAPLADEGAANHTRLRTDAGGLDVFAFGRDLSPSGVRPKRFAARQVREASEAIARRHGVKRALFLRQAPEAIDAGAFHNDVVAVGEGARFLTHGNAYAPGELERLESLTPGVRIAAVGPERLSLEDCVATYLFNSQLLEQDGRYVLLAPIDVQRHEGAKAVVEAWLAEGTIHEVAYFDLHQSMRNGGGPACLRLRVPLADGEVDGAHPGCLWSEARDLQLRAWAQAHYRERLRPEDLRDPALARESHEALDALTQLLELGSDFYPFQRVQQASKTR